MEGYDQIKEEGEVTFENRQRVGVVETMSSWDEILASQLRRLLI
jgi:hypothetical protein